MIKKKQDGLASAVQQWRPTLHENYSQTIF